jgi:hypothetical protein
MELPNGLLMLSDFGDLHTPQGFWFVDTTINPFSSPCQVVTLYYLAKHEGQIDLTIFNNIVTIIPDYRRMDRLFSRLKSH